MNITVNKERLIKKVKEFTEDYNRDIAFQKWRNNSLYHFVTSSMQSQILFEFYNLYNGTEYEGSDIQDCWEEYLRIYHGEPDYDERLMRGFFNKHMHELDGSDPEPYPSQSYKEAREFVFGDFRSTEGHQELLEWAEKPYIK